jgi:thioester reductase-like protein
MSVLGHLKEKRTIKNVLLTGVTGFLGRYLLIELLNLTNCNIYCIIRTDANFNDPQAKLNHILRTSGYEAYVNSPRIYCLAGNLEEKRLGLDAFIFENLENIIDSIYHCGACVHHLHAYETLRAANTLSTVELIKFALTKKIKELHYISTTSTILFSKYKKARIDLKEFEKPADIGPSKCGYLQSKWASEQILWSYIEKNLPFFIYRTGNITGHSLTGYCLAKDNHNLLLIKSFMQNKIAPRWNIPFEMTPVDIVSKSIVKISLYKNECNKKVFNIHNHNNISWEKYIKHIVISTNLKIKFVDKEEWRLNILPNLGPNNAIWPLKEFYQSLQLNGRFIERNILFLIDNKFLKIMKKLDICYPKKRDYSALINLYIDFLKNNFLENIVV